MSEKIFAYVSSWSHGTGKSGLCLYSYDKETGAFSLIKQIDNETEFAVSTIDKERSILYILDESANLPGMRISGGGRLFAYKIDPETGDLEQISCVPTFCANPTYVTMDKAGKHLVVSNHAGRACVTKVSRDAFGKYHMALEFDDSTVDLFTVNEDGSVGELVDVVKHYGAGPDPRFQMNPHPHCAVMSPSGNLFTVCDKGNDRVYMYTIKAERHLLVPASNQHLCPPGSRPRFCVYHPTQPYMYHNNEGRREVDAYRYEEDGRMELIGSFGIAMEETAQLSGEWVQQDFRIDAKGEFIYSIVNDPAMVVVFKVDHATGELKLVQNIKLDTTYARACSLSPDGRFLAVTGRSEEGKVLTLAVGEDGLLSDTGLSVKQPCAAWITFYQP